MKTGRRNNNKGFSLVELLVIIAIIALMMGMFLLTTNILFTRAGRQCTKQLKHELEQVRIATMGKREVILKLYKKDGKYYVKEKITAAKIGDKDVYPVNWADAEEKQIGSSRVASIKVYKSDGSNDVLADGKYVLFKFNRSTGAFTDATDTEPDVDGSNLFGGVGYCISKIEIKGGNQTNTLELIKITGRVEEK